MSSSWPVLVAAGLATAGWLYTSRINIIVNRRHHTYRMIAEQVGQEKYEAARRRLEEMGRKGRQPDPRATRGLEKADIDALDYLLNQYEFIAAAIWTGDIDERLVRLSEHTRMSKLVNLYRDYIDANRWIYDPAGGANGATIWRNLDNIVARWDNPRRRTLWEWKYEFYMLRPSPPEGIPTLAAYAREVFRLRLDREAPVSTNHIPGIDHLVLATKDLDAQAQFYRQLGFQVGARNRHPWGTLNHIVQFDRTFLELIALEPGFQAPLDNEPVANFAGFLGRYIAQREGCAMLVLDSVSAEADQARFSAAGIAAPSTFFFERTGKRPDGSEVHVAFSLAFARTPAVPDAAFFVCQQHFPERFWNAALQRHDNTVTGVAAVSLQASDPERLRPFVEAYLNSRQTRPIDGGLETSTARGRVEILNPQALADRIGAAAVDRTRPDNAFASVRFAVRDMDALRQIVKRAAIEHAEHRGNVVVPPTQAYGVALVFAPAG